MVSGKNKENNSSHSLLEIPWEKNESSIQKNTEYFQTLKSTILNTSQNSSQDLFFYSYNFVLPTIFKNFSLPFSHTFSSETKIKILKEKLIFEIKVFSIEDIFNLDCQNELIFLTGRKKLKSKCKSEQSKKYKEAVLNQKEYFPEPSFYDRIKERIYELQLRNNVNLSFIESSDDLIRELRSLIKSFDKEEYIPKVKKQNTSQSFLNNLLLLIPGVSKNVSKCIGNKFGNFNNMINNINDLHDIEIINDDKINKRKLTKKQIELIKELLGIK